MHCSNDHTFENWAHTLKFKPSRYCQPESEADVIALVTQAINDGIHIRTQGTGHSWSQLVTTTDTLVELDKLKGTVTVDAQGRATAPAGIQIKDLTKVLAKKGWGLKNLGSIQEQTIAGATATGTHGTGAGLGNLSSQLIGMRIVDGTGTVRNITEQDMPGLQAARVSLGALGIVTEVTIQCIPDYQLEYTAYWCSFNDIVDHLDTLNAENDRVRLWWLLSPVVPRDHVIVTTMNKDPKPQTILGQAPSLINGLLALFGGATLPMDTPDLLSMLLGIFGNPSGCPVIWHMKGHYTNMLTVPALPIFHRECEYAIPADQAGKALHQIHEIIQEGDFTTTLPIEVRFVAADNILLSPANGRDVCYIGINTMPNATDLFERVEPIMKVLGGRPHWGKHYTLTKQEVMDMYPVTYTDFVAKRQEFDPQGVFTNTLLSQFFSQQAAAGGVHP
jgi:FAD/FMN-containing dehydrogenase